MDDIQEIKSDVKELLQRSAVHNQILSEHKNFSIALQNEQKVINAKMEPLIKDHYIQSIVLKVCGTILVGLSIQFLVRYIMSHS